MNTISKSVTFSFLSLFAGIALLNAGCCPKEACLDDPVECQSEHIWLTQGEQLQKFSGGTIIFADMYHDQLPQFENQTPPPGQVPDPKPTSDQMPAPKVTFTMAKLVQPQTKSSLNLNLVFSLRTLDGGESFVRADTSVSMHDLSTFTAGDAQLIITTEIGDTVKKVKIVD